MRMFCATIAVGFLLAATACFAGDDATAKRTRVVPWLELGLCDYCEVERTVEGLRAWRAVTDTVILSVDAARALVLREIRQRVPELHYIPGLKTSPILVPTGFDSVDGWRQVAISVQELREITGSRFVLFEHESAIRRYVAGEQPIDMDKLVIALRELPQEMTYLWYPSAAMSGDVLDRYLALARAAESLPSVAFIDHASFLAPRFTGTPGTVACVQALQAVASKRLVPKIHCAGQDYYLYAQVPGVLTQADAEWVIVYPGSVRWTDLARDLATRLPVARPSSLFPALTVTTKPAELLP